MFESLRSAYYVAKYYKESRLFSNKLRWENNSNANNIQKNVLIIYRLEPRSGGLRNIGRIITAISKVDRTPWLIYIHNKSPLDKKLCWEYGFGGTIIYTLPQNAKIILSATWLLNDSIMEYCSLYNAKWRHIIQDYDELFFPVSAQYYHALNVKKGPELLISSGKWMSFNQNAAYLPFPVDFSIYNANKVVDDIDIDILFFHKPELPRRSAILCDQMAQALLKRKPSIKIGYYGSNISKLFKISGVKYFNSVSTLGQLAKIYNGSKIGFSVNFTNPSLIPFEQAACGCLPISPFLSQFPEFYLPGIHIQGSINFLVNHIIDLIDSNRDLKVDAQRVFSEYLNNNYICDSIKFNEIIADCISDIW